MFFKEQIGRWLFWKKEYCLSIFSGLLLTVLFPPFHLSLLAPIALAPLILAQWHASWKNAAKYGFVAGVTFFVTLLWWLGPTIGRYGELPTWASYPAFFLLVCYLASYLAVWSALSVWFLSKRSITHKNKWQNAFVLAAIWTVLEWLRGYLLSGFPWGALAYSLADYPLLIQSADIWGHYGVCFLIVSLNVFICMSWLTLKDGWSEKCCAKDFAVNGVIVICIVVFVIIYGKVRIQNLETVNGESSKAINVFLFQPGIATDVKWEHDNQQMIVAHYETMVNEAMSAFDVSSAEDSIEFLVPRLILFPETAAPFYLQDPTPLSVRLLSIAAEHHAYMISGSPAYMYENDMKRRYTNSAYLVLPTGEVAGRYDKQHLVPFGEYLPWGKLTAWIQDLIPFVLDFAPGISSAPLSSGELKAGMLICFESIFPELAINTVRQGANFLAVITNDAWFGPTGAPYQHEDMAVFRAVETRRWLIRAANTGISSVIDPLGKRQFKTPVYEITSGSHLIYLRDDVSWYVRFGEGWFVISCFVGLLWIWLLVRRSK